MKTAFIKSSKICQYREGREGWRAKGSEGEVTSKRLI